MLDFGAARDGVPEDKRGRRIVVDLQGREIADGEDVMDEGMFIALSRCAVFER